MAKGVNKCLFIGNLVRDPESRAMPDGTATCRFTVAVSDDYKDKNTGEKKEITDFIPVFSAGKLAEICSTYLKKGKQVHIEGRFKTRKWTDKEGVERYTTEIHLDNMLMLGGRSDDSSAPSSGSGYRNSPGYQKSPTGSRNPAPDPAHHAYEDDIPF